MRLRAIHNGKLRGKDGLKQALGFIYGHNALPMGSARPKLHQVKYDTNVDPGSRVLGARQYDQGTPWKLRHRQFFRMSNDGAQGTIRY